MKKEDQVCSLEPAKKLKELGVEQDSYWFWFKGHCNDKWSLEPTILAKPVMRKGLESGKILHAFTVAELGEMLPTNCYTQRYLSKDHPVTKENKKRIKHMKANNWYCVRYDDNFDNLFGSPTEANARAKMLIYLIENNLITKGK